MEFKWGILVPKLLSRVLFIDFQVTVPVGLDWFIFISPYLLCSNFNWLWNLWGCSLTYDDHLHQILWNLELHMWVKWTCKVLASCWLDCTILAWTGSPLSIHISPVQTSIDLKFYGNVPWNGRIISTKSHEFWRSVGMSNGPCNGWPPSSTLSLAIFQGWRFSFPGRMISIFFFFGTFMKFGKLLLHT